MAEKLEKLSGLLKGRTISGTGNADNALTIHFSDNSQLVVQTQGNTNSASTGGTVEAVEQTEGSLTLHLQGGGTFAVPIADTDKPIELQSGDKTTEYDG